jgi:hypothetical protein
MTLICDLRLIRTDLIAVMKPDLTLVTNTVEFAGFPVTRRRTPNSGVNSYVGICCPFPEQTITISIFRYRRTFVEQLVEVTSGRVCSRAVRRGTHVGPAYPDAMPAVGELVRCTDGRINGAPA